MTDAARRQVGAESGSLCAVELYEGRVKLSGSTAANATIDDLDSLTWKADVRDIATFDFQPGLTTVELVDGSRAGQFAIGELQYAEGSQVLRYREGPTVVFGRTAFERRP